MVGVPVLNRADMAARMVSTIDVPARLVVVVNGKVDGIRPPVAAAAAANHNIVGVDWVMPATNLGVAASWNQIIRTHPSARCWLIANADIAFAPGDLYQLDTVSGPGVWCFKEFAAFALTPDTVDAVGWFDENFHPIYYEDNDYTWRCRLAGVPVTDLEAGTTHTTSSTIHSGFWADNQRTFPQNGAYYFQKWGGMPGQERHQTPFDLPVGIDWWRLDRNRLVQLAWEVR
ncbi:MAG TPA: hypothetical protein VF377_10525 [Acidimicrobiia bacterium]